MLYKFKDIFGYRTIIGQFLKMKESKMKEQNCWFWKGAEFHSKLPDRRNCAILQGYYTQGCHYEIGLNLIIF